MRDLLVDEAVEGELGGDTTGNADRSRHSGVATRDGGRRGCKREILGVRISRV